MPTFSGVWSLTAQMQSLKSGTWPPSVTGDVGIVYGFHTGTAATRRGVQYILISTKLSDEQDNSEVQKIQKDFQNIMTSIRNCIYTPNIGSRFAENYKSSIYEGEIQQTPQPVQSESSQISLGQPGLLFVVVVVSLYLYLFL